MNRHSRRDFLADVGRLAPTATFSCSGVIALVYGIEGHHRRTQLGVAARMKWCCVRMILVVAMPAVAPIVAFGVTVGQTDNFEDGSLRNWQAGGSTNPNGPANITSGGPTGATDNYLRLTSNGSSRAGGRLVAFCSNQWTGNYRNPSITSLRMQVNNLGATSLALRLIFENASVGQSLGTISPVNVPVGSGWTTVTFSLASANLIGGTFNTVMGNVTELNLVHSPSVITDRSSAPRVAAQLGVDNITAVPEPSVLVLATAGLATVICWALQNRTKRR